MYYQCLLGQGDCLVLHGVLGIVHLGIALVAEELGADLEEKGNKLGKGGMGVLPCWRHSGESWVS